MKTTQHLLLLAAFVLLGRGQQKPQVSTSPPLQQIFSGDLFFLRCDNSTSGSRVKWYFNGIEQTLRDKTWKIDVATRRHSGSYECESNGVKSSSLSINVLDYIPSASLTIKTGQPVMQTGSSVILQLDNEDGLQGWNCWVYRGGPTKKIFLRLANDSTSLTFQPTRLEVPETIFWCSDTQQRRSNQIIVRTSEKEVSLEMYHLPFVVGESATLVCLVWGTDQIRHVVFYKDNTPLLDGPSSTYEIPHVTESAAGRYKCDATFTYKERTAGPPYRVVSDNQELFVRGPPLKAALSVNNGMTCSCPDCPSGSYRWYHQTNGQPWVRLDSNQEFMMPRANGVYACRAVWSTGRSLLSNIYHLPPNTVPALLIMLLILGLAAVVVAAVGCFIYYKKRNDTGPIYEDMPLRSRDMGDDKYEMLQKGAQGAGEYDTLHPEAPARQKKEGEYEALKKDEMTRGEYHTLGMEGAVVVEGGYEALKKEGMKEAVYHTLGMEGAVGAEGGYEALKKEGMKEAVYHTLGMEGAAGGGGIQSTEEKE